MNSSSADRLAAERWFVHRGLSSMLPRRARWRRLWPRSAPALTVFATVMVASLIAVLAGRARNPSPDGNPTLADWVIIVVLVLVVPTALAAARAVGRITDDRRRGVVAAAALVVALVCDLFNGPTSNLITDVGTTLAFLGIVLLFNGLGIGAVIGWAVRLTEQRLTSVGGLIARALPVVLLTVLVFFSGAVWSMAAAITRQRMWAVVIFLLCIAVAFLTTGIGDRVRPILTSSAPHRTDAENLAGSPFSAMPDPPTAYPLTRMERVNVMFVVITSAIAQIGAAALVTSIIFVILGLLALTPELMTDWSHHAIERETWMGFTLPINRTLVDVSTFLGALTFMYVSARAVTDKEYQTQFLDPVIDDLRLTLVARNRYRHHLAAEQP